MCGFAPFEAPEQADTYKRICKIDLRFPDHVSQEAMDFVAAVWPLMYGSGNT